MEGVSMYLTPTALAATARATRANLPNAILVCDLMTRRFLHRFSRSLRRELGERGAELQDTGVDNVQAILAAGYRVRSHASIVGRAQQAGTVRLPRWLLATFLRELRDGYQVWVFDPTNPQSLVPNFPGHQPAPGG
jgi:hypothetical protein